VAAIAANLARDLCARTGETPLNAIGRTTGLNVDNPAGKVIPLIPDSPAEWLKSEGDTDAQTEEGPGSPGAAGNRGLSFAPSAT
jgi:hypothetical protein